MNLDSWKKEFLAYFEKGGRIEVNWDSGHAYHTHSAISPDECEDPDSASDFESDYVSEYGPCLYCCPSVLNKLGAQVVADECYELNCTTDEEKVEYLEGFIQQATAEGSAEWYQLHKLQEYVDTQLKVNLQMTKILSE